MVTDSTDEIVITNIEKQSEVRIQSDESQIDLSAVIEGKWMGAFGNSQLTIVIEEVKGFQISGYNLVKGNKRDIHGFYEKNGDRVSVTLNEPGDDKWDGVFYVEFNIDEVLLNGEWKSNNGKIHRSFALKKNTSTLNMSIVGEYIIEAIPYTRIKLKSDNTCLLEEIDMSKMEDNGWADNTIKLKGSWYNSGNSITIEWWGAYDGEKKSRLTYSQSEGQGGYDGEKIITFDKTGWYLYKVD